jgi:hypothetical protein
MAVRKQRTSRIRQRGASRSLGSRNSAAGRIFDAFLVLSGGLAQERMAAGAEKIQELAEATRDLGWSMPDIPEAKNYVAFAADNLEALATYVSETDFAGMVEDASVFARRHPVAVMCAGVAVGLVATQLLRTNAGGFASRRRVRAARPSASNETTQSRPSGKKAANGRAHAQA